MSGIVGVLRTDGAAVDTRLIQRLTRSLAFAGPDAQAIWCEGPAAFGHTLLRTTDEFDHAHQPFSLDGRTWILADVRLDARNDLIGKLRDVPSRRVSDVELTLRAYARWGDTCVNHLLGDFVFAIWDGRRRRLFCGRDHMGVKPLYYAHIGHWLLFSNALECVRRHPAVSDKLHDLAIADFLLFGVNQDLGTTSFHDIRRLPPAHTLTWSEPGVSLSRYWTLPIEEPLHYRTDREYIDQFKELLREAVSDRLRTDRLGVFMSGGLDSPALAATARDLLRHEPGRRDRIRAFTFVYDSLIPDSERQYADQAARSLAIPISFYALDEPSQRAPAAPMGTPEPGAAVTDRSPECRCYSDMAAHSRVAFYGEGPDNALIYEWRPYLAYLLRRRRWGRLAADALNHVISHKRVPLLSSLPRIARARWTSRGHDASFPGWIAPQLVSRLRLKERWHHRVAPADHPVRPMAHASLLTPMWPSIFESFQPSYTGVPLEVRHPYVDIRLLRFLLRVPALPWCRNKYLLRCALRGVLPEAVRLRPKTPLGGDPGFEGTRRHGLPAAAPSPLFATYADVGRLSNTRVENVAGAEAALRAVALSYWLPQVALTVGAAR